jgi:hypothetical protein
MSCWETSKFLNDQSTVDKGVMIKACKELGWEIKESGQTITVIDANQGSNLFGEYALQIKGNNVSYNTYYMDNGKSKVDDLRKAYLDLYLPIIEKKIKDTFKSVGYSIKPNTRFKPDANRFSSFYVVSSSKLESEKGVEGKIKFTILRNGNVETDSNYIPEDIHDLADRAMDLIEKQLHTERIITPKPRHLIPASQRTKAHCKAKTKKNIRLKK